MSTSSSSFSNPSSAPTDLPPEHAETAPAETASAKRRRRLHISPPPPPIVAATLSGFVLGIIATLAVIGIGSSPSNAVGTATLPPSTPVADTQLKLRVTRIVTHQLGLYYPNSKIPRLQDVEINDAGPPLATFPNSGGVAPYHSVYIKFRLDDHPLGKVWRMKAARADVFAVMRALYVSQMPIYSVWMDGTFPLGPRHREETVLSVYMDHLTASHLPWKRWSRDDEGRLWSLLPYRSVDPRFA